MIQLIADPSVRKAPLLFSFAQSQYSAPPEFPQPQKEKAKSWMRWLYSNCALTKDKRERQKMPKHQTGKGFQEMT